ncbi:integrase core domain protein [Trichonephila inaurata madagascariensis]|uniref:Integrase core domain protein n=1 Tax=Trichonephila inaurata madagascariensis TaxID=2747483 RepID=A0A8X6JX90_9ARAC|nr:integrase core domain protein [Trichonephila inaurata madagascariensis]
MYLVIKTRSDLAYNVGFLSRSLENPSAEDIVKVRVFRCIAGSVGYGITYYATETKGVLHCYSDSDFRCTQTSRSNSGYVMIYAGGVISYGAAKSKLLLPLQQLKLFIAASEAVKEHLTPQKKTGPGNEKCGPLLKWSEHSVPVGAKAIPCTNPDGGINKYKAKLGKCDDHTELKLEDRVRGDTKQEKYEEQLIKIEDNPIERPLSQEDLSDSETDREDAEPTSDRQLRNHLLLQKPKRFEDHIILFR